MPEESGRLEQNKREKPMSALMLAMITGFCGGILWSGIGYLAYLFHFTSISPLVILEPWAIGNWKYTWLGMVISIIAIGIVSIGAALVYYAFMRKMKNIWPGIAYGIVLFFLVFFVLNPIFPSIKPFTEMDLDTLITCGCLYILFGLFVGYSISYEENELSHEYEKASDEEQEQHS
ncbi:YqhR family membrane protein [Falsibacillus pallidus]|uniref:YqhR family membrane protein n=1 Tax=Falsibacillus pallidus TaxID=493781 RepID=UPI003D974E2C